MSLSAGVLTLGKLTPGVVSFGPMLAAIAAQQAAISSFPLGAEFGTLWYGMFPVLPSTQLLFSLSGGLLAIGSLPCRHSQASLPTPCNAGSVCISAGCDG